jgi:hypothetical protein
MSCLLAGSLAASAVGAPAQAATPGVRLVAASDSVAVQPGRTFATRDFYVRRAGDRIVLSGSADGTADFYADDVLQLEVTRPDGTVARRRFDDSDGCTADRILTTAPVNIASLLRSGVNKVRMTLRDACGGDYGSSDIWLAGAAVSRPGPTLAAMDGGTRIDVHHLKAGQGVEECTTGFTVQTADRLYMTTAKHCFTGANPTDTNLYVADAMPVSVTTADRPGHGGPDKYTFAQQLSCLVGTGACLLPPNRYAPGADMLAFVPDTATPTALVQTARGRLRVLGKTTAAALSAIRPAPRVCHYGLGSLRVRGNSEQCGTLLTGHDKGLTWLSAPAFGGDSGGPVYYYAPNGAGVYALGLTLTARTSCDRLRRCHTDTGFVPMDVVESALAARLRTAA